MLEISSNPVRNSLLGWILGGGLWLAGIGGGFWVLYLHAFTPAAVHQSGGQWPSESAVPRTAGRYALVVAAHPECPCSQATVAELDQIIAAVGDRMTTTVLFLDEKGLPQPAVESRLWKETARISRVAPVTDPSGKEARRFGLMTSGETRLYSPEGKLLFHGGTTASRGHEGSNPGEEAIIAFVLGQNREKQRVTTPVFGCALFNGAEGGS